MEGSDEVEVEEVYERDRPEDAACGNPCGGEPLMCGRCPELMGESEPDYDPDMYLAQERDDPCSYCDSPCEECLEEECLQGPDLEHRSDYAHMKEVCSNEEMAQCQADYYRACKHCGYDTVCDRRDTMCRTFARSHEP